MICIHFRKFLKANGWKRGRGAFRIQPCFLLSDTTAEDLSPTIMYITTSKPCDDIQRHAAPLAAAG